jgi:hypothetical protein
MYTLPANRTRFYAGFVYNLLYYVNKNYLSRTKIISRNKKNLSLVKKRIKVSTGVPAVAACATLERGNRAA